MIKFTKETIITFETAKIIPKDFIKEVIYDESYWEILKDYYCYDYRKDENFLMYKKGKVFCAKNGEKEAEQISYPAPTQSLLQKWLREKYNIDVLPFISISDGKYYMVSINESQNNKRPNQYNLSDDKYIKTFKTYEEALEVGLKEGLKLASEEIEEDSL